MPFLPPAWDDLHPDFLRIDATLPDDHHARWLAVAVARLDLQPLQRSYANRGSLAYLPPLLVAFVLFMYSQGILSPAAWARHARYDDQSKWLLRGLRPSRSQLYTFRERLEPFLDAWHRQLIDWAIVSGLTNARRGSLDGTFVASLASRHQLMSVRRIDKRLLLLRLLVGLEEGGRTPLASQLDQLPSWIVGVLYVYLSLAGAGLEVPSLGQTLDYLLALLALLAPEETVDWQPRLPSWVPATPAGRQRVLRRYVDAAQRLTQRLEPYRHKATLSKKDQQTIKHLKVSLTDSEAALGWDKTRTYRPLYNLLLVQATDAPLTLAWDVLSRNNDDGLLKPMMERTREQLGRPLEEVLVDGAFVTVGDVVWCEQQPIVVYAPPTRAQVVQQAVAKAEGAEAQAPKAEGEPAQAPKAEGEPAQAPKVVKLPKSAFRYDPVENVYHCPEGKQLPEVSRTTVQRSGGLALPMAVHQARGQDCQACPQQQGCTSNPKKGRAVKRYEGEESLLRLQERMEIPANQRVYRQRRQTVELGYADIKEHRGLRKFRCFGKRGARIQAGLVILASNSVKIMQALRQGERAEQLRSPPEKQPA